MGWRQMGTVALLVTAASAAAAAERSGQPLQFETLKDAHERQGAADYKARSGSRSLLQNPRPTPLGDVPVKAVPPPASYTTQPRGLHTGK